MAVLTELTSLVIQGDMGSDPPWSVSVSPTTDGGVRINTGNVRDDAVTVTISPSV